MYNDNNNNKRQTLNTQQKIQSFKLMSFLQRSSIQCKRITHNIPKIKSGRTHLPIYVIHANHRLFTWSKSPKKLSASSVHQDQVYLVTIIDPFHCQKISLQLKNQLGRVPTAASSHTLLPWFKYLSISSLLTAFSLLPLLVADSIPPLISLPLFQKTNLSPLFLSSRSFQSHLTPTIKTDPKYHNSTLAALTHFCWIIGLFWRSIWEKGENWVKILNISKN